jgi:hypothetical protein
MTQHEYFQVLVDSHRNDLRSLASHVPEGVVIPSRHHAAGQLIVRLGRWLEGRRPEVANDAPATLSGSSGSA